MWQPPVIQPRLSDIDQNTGVLMRAAPPTHVEFRYEPIEQTIESANQGKPVYKDVLFITIAPPGDRTTIVDRPADEDDKMKYRDAYEHFTGQSKMSQTGTPLEVWPIMKKSKVYELKAQNIYTIEQLAAVPDSALHYIGGAQLRDLAIAYLDEAQASALLNKYTHENEALKGKIEAQDEQIKQLADAVRLLQAAKTNNVQLPEISIPQESTAFVADDGLIADVALTAYKQRGRPKKEAA